MTIHNPEDKFITGGRVESLKTNREQIGAALCSR